MKKAVHIGRLARGRCKRGRLPGDNPVAPALAHQRDRDGSRRAHGLCGDGGTRVLLLEKAGAPRHGGRDWITEADHMFENQRDGLKSPLSTPKAQGILQMIMGVMFTAQGVSGGALNWLRWLQITGGLAFLLIGAYALATAARSK